ncbi:ATP-grasp domain-containing protein [Actinophytocola algeriensis]|uniref:Biotin carboxylase n=1 Tax=Actinophytocola algeriensis TaxID=1768010 RepID=A0A7W7Q2G7_9PSEU|nr:ATP-grasp domain-containing protein [Actinophytocola algeriensis]MBB4905737.1 biotin carboxylase [Actinophytocola algeriensis]MBE1472578.1 biotin carboxylase [Actinophytocola algeriensis]
MTSLVVLGAADGAVPTYQRAAKLGYRTICVDIQPGAPGVPFADEYLHISTRAPEQVAAALAGRTDIVGVLAPASDIALPSQRWLARHWDLPDPISEQAVLASADKSVFREVCERLGFPVYGAVAGTVGSGLREAALGLRFPTLVKPVDSTGSRGVVPCGEPGGLTAAIRAAIEHSPSGRVVVEEHVTGEHLTVEAVVSSGRVLFHAVSARTLTAPPYFITAEQLLPADLPPEVDRRLVTMLDKLCAELGYVSGPLNLDVVLAPDGQLYFVEMGARTGGNGLAELIETMCGVDTLSATIALAVGDRVVLAPRPPRPVMLRVIAADRPGTLAAVHGIRQVTALPEVVDLRLFAQPGDHVRPYTQAAHKVGYVVLSAATASRLRAAAAVVDRTLRVELAGP